LISALVVFATTGAAARGIVISDPTDDTPKQRLLRHAVIDQLRQSGAKVHPIERLSQSHLRALKQRQRGRKLLTQAKDLYESLELEPALRSLNKAISKLERAAAVTGEVEELKQAFTLLGACHLLMSNKRQATAALERMLVLEYEREPDENIFSSGEMIDAYDDTTTKVQNLPRVDVPVSVQPEGAMVYLNGRLVGPAPTVLKNVPRGKHYVYATLDGHSPLGKQIEVKRGAEKIGLLLQPADQEPQLLEQMVYSVGALEKKEQPEAIRKLLRAFDVDEVTVVKAGDPHRLGRYSLKRKRPRFRQIEGDLEDLASAKVVAARLLSPARGNRDADDDRDRDDDDMPGLDRDSDSDPDLFATTEGFGSGSKKPYVVGTAYVLAGLSGIGWGITGFLALNANKKYNQTSGSKPNFNAAGTTDQLEGESIASSGKRYAKFADILMISTLVTGITGLALHIFWDGDTASDAMDSSAWSLAPGSLNVTF